jgi:hypothetical protein
MWMLGNRITLGFTEGDSTNFETLESVFVENGGFDVAIVVPPVDSKMSAQAQDTRLMMIMCTLRTICEDNKLPPVHVVGENRLESSAQLALRPKKAETIDETDFVNVQAIIARATCQAMAFPFMQPAVVQLFSTDESSPSIHLSLASLFVPLHVPISFAELIDEVKKVCENAICIGYRQSIGQHIHTTLCPKLEDRCSFQKGDVVIVISRGDPASFSSEAHGSFLNQDCLSESEYGSTEKPAEESRSGEKMLSGAKRKVWKAKRKKSHDATCSLMHDERHEKRCT